MSFAGYFMDDLIKTLVNAPTNSVLVLAGLSFLAIAVPFLVGTLLIVLAAFIIYWLYRRSNRETT